MINRLAWDSDCFGYEVGVADIATSFDMDKFMEESQAFQLIYIFSKSDLPNLPSRINKVDEKITLKRELHPFAKTIQGENQSGETNSPVGTIISLDSIEKDFSEMPIKVFNQTFVDLALVSGEYSRFKTDQRLCGKEYEKLYHSWAHKALIGNDPGFVFVREGRVQGMVTLTSTQSGIDKIALLAVLGDSRNQGIGRLLLDKASKIAGENGSRSLRVTTQKSNRGAMSLYQKEGFNVIEEWNVYHWWRG